MPTVVGIRCSSSKKCLYKKYMTIEMGNILAPVLGNVAYFIVPFADLPNNWLDPVFLSIAVVWSIIVENTKIEMPFGTDEIALVISILSGTLGFLLSLLLNKYLIRNKQGIAEFESLVGNIEGFAWTVSTIPIDKSLKLEMLSILKIMPNAVKHVFRGDYSYEGQLKGEKDLRLIKIVDEMKSLDPKANNVVNTFMFMMMKRAHKTDNSLLRLFHKKWESLYGPYGKIASLIGYDTPVLFEYIISTAFFFYTFLLPISYTTYGNQNVLITFIILYFYIGLKSAGLLLQNPFVALPKGVTIFPIATKVSKETRNNIENIQRYCLSNACTKKMSNKIKLDLD